MNKKGRWIYILLIVLPIVAVVGAIVINELYKTGKGYTTVWGAAEVLAYFGAVLSSLGSAAIGIVSWNQNKRILQVQEESFLVHNYSTVIVDSIRIGGLERTAGSLDLYDYPIVSTKDSSKRKNSVDIIVKMLAIENIPEYIRIKSVFLFVKCEESQKKSAIIEAVGLDSEFSRVAISKDNSAFVRILLLLSNEEKDELRTLILDEKDEKRLEIDIDMEIVSPKNVCSQIKCRAFLKKGNSIDFFEQDYDTTPPVLFMYGKEIIDPHSLGIKSDSLLKDAQK